jgi:hypothetical protein
MDERRVQRARAVDSTQVKTADRGLRLQPIVTRRIVFNTRTTGTYADERPKPGLHSAISQ